MIDDEIRKARKQLDLLLRKAQDTLKALNTELHEESVERASPIALAADSLQSAASCLAAGDATDDRHQDDAAVTSLRSSARG
jgi:hypothetical protein